jgi:hypothetical protein
MLLSLSNGFVFFCIFVLSATIAVKSGFWLDVVNSFLLWYSSLIEKTLKLEKYFNYIYNNQLMEIYY